MNFLAKRNQGTKTFVKVKWHVATRKGLYSYNAPSSIRNKPVHLRREWVYYTVSFKNVSGSSFHEDKELKVHRNNMWIKICWLLRKTKCHPPHRILQHPVNWKENGLFQETPYKKFGSSFPAFQMLTVKKEEDLKMIASRIATFSLQREVWEGPYLFQRLTSHSSLNTVNPHN